MNKVLLLYCHPWPHKSRYNRRLLAAARKVRGVEIRDLYELYPDLHVDAEAEQLALTQASAVIFLFPIYWFSAPSLMKEWMDVVLQAGFAFGDGGNALKGKRAIFAVSTGGAQTSYAQGGKHGAPIEAFLLPFEMTMEFCGMDVQDPFVAFDVRTFDNDAIGRKAKEFAYCLKDLVETCDGRT